MKTSILKRLHALEPVLVSEREAWEKIRLAILYALDDSPDAQMAVVERIQSHPNRGNMEWPELRGVILDSLQTYPAARESVLTALKDVET